MMSSTHPTSESKTKNEAREEVMIERYHLTPSSWYDMTTIPHILGATPFGELWSLHPAEFGEVKIYNKVMRTPRWQQTYGKAFFYSGMQHPALPIPTQLQPFLDWVNSLDYGHFNEINVNWYGSGHHYIGRHRDDETDIVSGTPIVSISLGQTRKFRIRQYTPKKAGEILVDVDLHDGDVIVMGGDFQTELTHEIPKVGGRKGENMGRRINITFRQMK